MRTKGKILKRVEQDRLLDEALEQTFPTSDPIALQQASIIGRGSKAAPGRVAELVGIEGGVVSEVINLESSGVRVPDRRPRHGQQYHEDGSLTG